jgi:hypothetical protein
VIQTIPVNSVEGLSEIKLQHDRWNFPLIAGLHNFSREDESF